MPKKIIITEKQLIKLNNYISESNDNIIKTINENILEEGFKEIALSLLMLAGVTLSGQNKAVAQDALTNDKIIQSVDDVLSDTNKLNDVIDKISVNMPDAGDLIKLNADKIKSTINYIESKNKNKEKISQNTQTTTTASNSILKRKLKQGYALTNIETIKDTLPVNSIVVIQDTIDFKWSSDNFFSSGSYDLNSDASDSIKIVLNNIKNAGGKVIGVYVESSTDTEPISIGNEKLSELRANSVANYIKSTINDSVKYNVVTKPNSGPNVYHKGMSKGDRVDARIKTAKYRYVNLKLVVVFNETVKGNANAPQIIEKHVYELTKVYQHVNKVVKLHNSGGTNKTTCKKVKVGKHASTSCKAFGGSTITWGN